MNFTLMAGGWYACDFLGDAFGSEAANHSPVKIEEIMALKTGNNLIDIQFIHANYPSGVQSKRYRVKVIERSNSFLLAGMQDNDLSRYLHLTSLTEEWFRHHFPQITFDAGDLIRVLESRVIRPPVNKALIE